MPIKLTHKGDLKATTLFLDNAKKKRWLKDLNKFGAMGVDALRAATPKDTGKTSESWSYEIVEKDFGFYELIWNNSNMSKHISIAALIQYGHGTRNGGYVPGIDYINPAMKPIFDRLAERVWEVTLT